MSKYTAYLVLLVLMFFQPANNEDIKCNELEKEYCSVEDLSTLNGIGNVTCIGLRHDNQTVCHKGQCIVSIDIPLNESSALLYKDIPENLTETCIHGKWSGTASALENNNRNKRFWGAIIIAFIAGIILGVQLCKLLCFSGGNPNPRSPPTIEPCPPSDIQEEYFTPAGETEMQINWTEPTAKGNNPTLKEEGDPKNGDIFLGSSGEGEKYTVMYEAYNGLQKFCQFSFRVKVRTCLAAPWVTNGRRNCPQTLSLGASCSYECNTGYRMVGQNNITCVGDTSPNWTQEPSCQEITCDDNLTVTNGVFECTGRTYRSMCSVNCHEGYRLDEAGVGYATCQSNGSWSSMGVVTCKDTVIPKIYCPYREVFYVDKGENSTLVYWTLPRANDTTDSNPNVVQTAGPGQGSMLNVGSIFVKYKAVDKDGNESPECTIELIVLEITCDHPRTVMTDEYLRIECTNTVLTWGSECSLSCLNNFPLNGSTLVTCESDYDITGDPSGYWDFVEDTEPHCIGIELFLICCYQENCIYIYSFEFIQK